MGRLTEGGAQRLAAALSIAAPAAAAEPAAAPLLSATGAPAVAPLLSAAGAPALSPDDGEVERLRSVFHDEMAADDFGRRLTLDLAKYLNRPVRCSIVPASSPIAGAWRFEAAVGQHVWWIDLDVDLAVEFADAAIGGDGTAKLGRGRRVRVVAERVAQRMFAIAAAAAGFPAPRLQSDLRSNDASSEAVVIAGGLCAVATQQRPWQFGVLARTSDRLPQRASEQRPPVLVYEPAKTPQETTIETIVDSLCARLVESTQAVISSTDADIADPNASPDARSAPSALGIALTSGTGAIVALLDTGAVLGLAGAATGSPLPAESTVGDVILAAAEAIVRDALIDAGSRLPGIAEDAQRVVRLTDIPLTARTPHHAVEIRLAAGGQHGIIRLLVPALLLAPVERSVR